MGHEAKNPVKATRRSVGVLETLYELGSARLTEVSDALDLPDSTVHNHLSTLVECGLVTRDDDVYRISLRFLTFGEGARGRYRISGAYGGELEELAATVSAAASVVVLEDGIGYVLAHAAGGTDLPVDLYPGKPLSSHATAFGKVLLADLPDDDVDAIIEGHGLAGATAETITGRGALCEELETVRAQGYAVSDEERLRGVRSVATPVRNEGGVAVGAIGVTGPTSRLTVERLSGPVLEAITHTKNVVELRLAYS